MKEYEIYVSYEFGPDESYVVTAKNLAEAKKKARDRYAREYFKKSDLKAEKAL